jgi:integrase
MSNPTVQTSELARKKGVTLYKRDDRGGRLSPTDPGWKARDYYFRFQYQGQIFIRCLQTNDAEKAQKYARAKMAEIKNAIVKGEYDRLAGTSLRAPAASKVSELIKHYTEAPGDASETTRIQNAHALRQLLRTTKGAEADVDSLPVTEINAALAHAWFTAAGLKVKAAPDQATQNSLKKSANSRFVQASSLFTPRARASYQTKGLDQACFSEFTSAGQLQRFTRLAKDHYNPPADAIIQTTLADWLAIEDRNLFLAIGHELAFGLRKGELAQATWRWWSTREGYPVLDGAADVKSGSAYVQVRALDPWFNQMRARIEAKGWRGQLDDFIITGTETNRSDDIFRAVSEWIRNHKWETMKTNHALRAYAGSQVAMRYGIYEAQCWLRHSTVKVTEQHYTHFIKRFRPSDLSTLPARWAQAPNQAPELRIVEAT